MNKITKEPILITGVPRSGTTWVANILGQSSKTNLILEPDNEKYSFLARKWKKALYRFPFADGTTDSNLLYLFYKQIIRDSYPKNKTLINHSLNFIFGHDKANNEHSIQLKESQLAKSFPNITPPIFLSSILKNLTSDFYSVSDIKIIKTVHAGLCLPFLYQHFRPKMLILFRHPANVISSCLELKIEDGNRDIYCRPEIEPFLTEYKDDIMKLNDPLSFMGLQIGIFYYLWEMELKKQKEWISVTHENLCENSVEKFKNLFQKIGLEWSRNTENLILDLNKPGVGFKPNRVVENLVDKWKRKLSLDQIIKIQKGYSILPIKHYEEFRL